MDILNQIVVADVVSTIVFTFIGVLMMGACWWAINKISPFSVVREIEQDQNVALAIIVGSIFLSLSIIIASVVIS